MITSVSPVTRRYVREFFLRLAVFGLVLLTWVFAPERLTFTAPFQWSRWPLAVLWVAVFVSMAAQLDPNSRLTAGCMKQYPARFDPVPGYDPAALSLAVRRQNRGAVKVALVWLAVNLVIGALYHRKVLSAADLIALCALAYLCDLVCVLFFCPFQTFLMGNRCCVSCRIFAWGSWMMAAPLMCVPTGTPGLCSAWGWRCWPCGSGGTPGTRSGSGRVPTACSSAPTARSSCAGTNFPAPPNSAEDTICARRHCRRARFPSL